MTEQQLTAFDGETIHLRVWEPNEAPSLVVLLFHGMGEHSARYERFASALNDAGIAVLCQDHRGHGPNAELRGHFSDRNGWTAVMHDCASVYEYAQKQYADKPVVVMGHSMGSFIAQDFAMNFGSALAGLILSGTNWASKLQLYPGIVLAKLMSIGGRRRAYSPLLDKLGFDGFNKRFEPSRTAFDWLSRDEAEVDKYVDDPLCGGPYTIGLWIDLLGGVIGISSDAAINRIRSDLPILIFGGEDDPVGGDRGLGNIMTHYAQTSHQRLKLKIYEGGRHEMLNETNRDEVTADVLEWLSRIKT